MAAVNRTADWINPTTPYFALANSSNIPGPNIQVSSITLPITGNIVMEGNTSNSAQLVFPNDPEPYIALKRRQLENNTAGPVTYPSAVGVTYLSLIHI